MDYLPVPKLDDSAPKLDYLPVQRVSLSPAPKLDYTPVPKLDHFPAPKVDDLPIDPYRPCTKFVRRLYAMCKNLFEKAVRENNLGPIVLCFTLLCFVSLRACNAQVTL